MNHLSHLCPSWCSHHPCDCDPHLGQGHSVSISGLVPDVLSDPSFQVFASQSGQQPDVSVHVTLYDGEGRLAGFLTGPTPLGRLPGSLSCSPTPLPSSTARWSTSSARP